MGGRWLAAGGVIGPAAFVGAWVAGAAATTRPYSHVHDAISRLAAVGADTRPLMTGGFVGFGVAVPMYAAAFRRVVDGPAWGSAVATGVATLAVAALPLDRSSAVDTWHGIAASVGYVTLAATPLLAARPLAAQGRRGLALAGVAAGVVSAVALLLTTTSLPHGLFQRVGLTASDAWIVASAVAMLADRKTVPRCVRP